MIPQELIDKYQEDGMLEDRNAIIELMLPLVPQAIRGLSDPDALGWAYYELVLGVERFKDCPHTNVVGYVMSFLRKRVVAHITTKRPILPLTVDVPAPVEEVVEVSMPPLQERDQQILYMSAEGFTDKQIAEKLGLSSVRIYQLKQAIKTAAERWRIARES